jgi:ABC-2 type transport system ATP-binding protein
VQAICQRVAIMDHGHILRNGPLGDLLRDAHARTDVRVAHWDATAAPEFAELVEVIAASNGDAQLRLRTDPSDAESDLSDRLARLLDALHARRIPVKAIETREANLEQLFLDLTGRRLRD